ncbi:MAG: hypothetical protein K9I94_14380 [Bacteroidales bacterium]|nr:hypothetical protein [Bacteroidales bacterium]
MGIQLQGRISKCIITEFPIERSFVDGVDAIEYYIKLNGSTQFISLSTDALEWHKTSSFFRNNKNKLAGILLNKKWPKDKRALRLEHLKEIINEYNFPRTPSEKSDLLFMDLYKRQKEDGQIINLLEHEVVSLLWKKLYFNSLREFNFYINYLIYQGQIKGSFNPTTDGYNYLKSYNITIQGIKYAIKLQEQGELSQNCFVAMSFSDYTQDIRKGIKNSLVKTGFSPIFIDEQIIDSDQTINDRIIAELKRCKFCIADFTEHKNGVYFESGFALG